MEKTTNAETQTLKKVIAENLLRKMEDNKISMYAVGKAIGSHTKAFAVLGRGIQKDKNYTIETLASVLNALGVEIEDFIK